MPSNLVCFLSFLDLLLSYGVSIICSNFSVISNRLLLSPWLTIQVSYWMHRSSWSQISTRFQWWKGIICHGPIQEKHQQSPQCVRSSIWNHYLYHCQGHWYPSHWYFQTMWRLHPGKSQAMSSQQKGCTLITDFRGKALLWHKLPIDSYFWQKVSLATGHWWLQQLFLELLFKGEVWTSGDYVRFYLQVQYLHCDFKKPASRKGWRSTLNIQPQLCLDKMGMLSASLLPFSTGYVPCTMVASLPPIYKVVYGQKLKTLPQS